jgi:hypothetical protein
VLAVLIDGETVASGGSFTSKAEHLRDGMTWHALEYEVSGDGTASLEVLLSISGKNWVSNGYAATGLVKTSGPNADGKGHLDLFLKPADFIKVKAASASDSNVIRVWFVQK